MGPYFQGGLSWFYIGRIKGSYWGTTRSSLDIGSQNQAGTPVAHDYGLLSTNYALLCDIAACSFPGRAEQFQAIASHSGLSRASTAFFVCVFLRAPYWEAIHGLRLREVFSPARSWRLICRDMLPFL